MKGLLLSFFLLLSMPAHATDYFWQYSASSGGFTSNWVGSNPDQGCQKYFSDLTSYYGSVSDTSSSLSPSDSSKWLCTAYSGYSWRPLTISRSGDSCPSGSTYNAATGVCDVSVADVGTACDGPTHMGMPSIVDSSGNCVSWLSADTAATCKYMNSQGTMFKTVYVQFEGAVPQKPDVSYLGCEVSVLDVANCTLPAARESSGIALAPNGANCKVAVSFTGNVSGSGGSGYPVADPSTGKSGVCAEGQTCDPADPPKVKDSQPCTYVTDGEGRKVCSAFDFQADPGTMNCGSVGGQFQCIPIPPKSTGQKIDTTVKTDTNSDGSTKTTKTDTYTKVVCSGVGSCTTSTTTTVSVTGKSSAGDVTSQTSNCTGPDCTGTNTNDKNGDGVPDCQSDNSCDSSSPTAPKLSDVDDYDVTTQKFYDSLRQGPLGSTLNSISMPSGGAPPNLVSEPIDALGGGTLSLGIIPQLKAMFVDDLSFAMKAGWCLAAICIFLSA